MSKDRTDSKNSSGNISGITGVVSRRLSALCEKNDMSKYRLSQLTGVTQTNLAHYISGENMPSLPTLEKISGAFGMTPAQFLTEDGAYIPQSPDRQAIGSLWAELSLEDRDCVFRIIQGLLFAEREQGSEKE